MPGNILIIDDEEQFRKLLSRVISLEGFTVTESADLKTATAKLKTATFDAVLCDVKLPDGNGVDFVKTIKNNYPAAETILLTAYGNIPDGVQAIKNGAFDYLVKGDENNRIIPLLNQAIAKAQYNRSAAVRVDKPSIGFDAILGQSKRLLDAVHTAQKIAVTDIPVLLLGETGSGKEVFANAIHQNSKRKDHSFVAINCSAFNKELLESELFGHKSGAFTGAMKDKKGLVEVAEKGTLFLDEIGELGAELQAKLLRFLENNEFIKLGDTKVSKSDVRIIAATNRNLQQETAEKRFREDLYFRLNVVSIELPALRERKEDIPLLAAHFLQRIAAKENKPLPTIQAGVWPLLENYPWKGNIRELKNNIERAFVLGNGTELLPGDFPYEIQQQTATAGLSLAAIEQHHIQKILQYTEGNKTRAAQLLGIGLATLYRKMEQYGISK